MYHSVLIHSSVDGHLGCFHVLAILNSVVTFIGVHMSLSILVSSVCMPKSGIAGSYGSSISRFLKNVIRCWWECKLVQPLWRTVWWFLKKLEIELPYDSAIPLLGIHTEETQIERDTCTPMFIAALFIIARTWKQPKCLSADKWIRKLWYIDTTEYLLNH